MGDQTFLWQILLGLQRLVDHIAVGVVGKDTQFAAFYAGGVSGLVGEPDRVHVNTVGRNIVIDLQIGMAGNGVVHFGVGSGGNGNEPHVRVCHREGKATGSGVVLQLPFQQHIALGIPQGIAVVPRVKVDIIVGHFLRTAAQCLACVICGDLAGENLRQCPHGLAVKLFRGLLVQIGFCQTDRANAAGRCREQKGRAKNHREKFHRDMMLQFIFLLPSYSPAPRLPLGTGVQKG